VIDKRGMINKDDPKRLEQKVQAMCEISIQVFVWRDWEYSRTMPVNKLCVSPG
jgi:hypothetical protein